MDELKPCPFCGGKAFITTSFGRPYIDAFHTRKCLIKPDTFLISSKSLNRQIKAWNRRAS